MCCNLFCYNWFFITALLMFFDDEDTGSETDSEREDNAPEVDALESYLIMNRLAVGDLFQVYESVQCVCKEAAHIIENGCIFECYPGESKKDPIRLIEKMTTDLIGRISAIKSVGYILPCYTEKIIQVGDGSGRLVFVFNAITGPANLDVGLPVGTTFAIIRRPKGTLSRPLDLGDLTGNNVIGAGYAVYGTNTVLVLAFGHGRSVHVFTLDTALGLFILKSPNLKIPKRGFRYSLDEGYTIGWDDATKIMATRMKDPRFGSVRSSIHFGSFAVDFHKIMRKGGFYMNPANKLWPNGMKSMKGNVTDETGTELTTVVDNLVETGMSQVAVVKLNGGQSIGITVRSIGQALSTLHIAMLPIYGTRLRELHLLQECIPIAYIAREAGGFATDGEANILDLCASSIDTLTPFYGGSMDDCLQITELNLALKANRLM